MYLENLESFWTNKALETFNKNDLADALEKSRIAVQKLSDLFTINRDKFKNTTDYMSDNELLVAYGLFFFPQSFCRAQLALKQTFKFANRIPENKNEFNILDIGSGASPCGFATATQIHENFPNAKIHLYAIDQSSAALNAAKEIATTNAFPYLTLSTTVCDLKHFTQKKQPLFNKKFDIIIAGWTLNEIFPNESLFEDSLSFIKKICTLLEKSGTLLILEPALKETSERLQKISDFFALHPENQIFRYAPELGDYPCPLLATGDFWNHEVKQWNIPETLEFINRTLFRDIKVLKYSWVALGNEIRKNQTPASENEKLFRLISPVEKTKASLQFIAINANGIIFKIEIPTRGLSKHDIKIIANEWERGSILAIQNNLESLNNGKIFRVKNGFQDIKKVF